MRNIIYLQNQLINLCDLILKKSFIFATHENANVQFCLIYAKPRERVLVALRKHAQADKVDWLIEPRRRVLNRPFSKVHFLLQRCVKDRRTCNRECKHVRRIVYLLRIYPVFRLKPL